VLISQGIPQLGGVKQTVDGKNKSSYTRGCRARYLALARLSCYIILINEIHWCDKKPSCRWDSRPCCLTADYL